MITRDQLLRRKDYLCSSDISSIYNANPFMTPYECWCSKIYSLSDIDNSEAIKDGNLLEGPIISWVSDNLKLEVDTEPDNLEFICEDEPLFMAHVDALVLNYPTILEVKNTGDETGWGYSGGDSQEDIPARVYIQVQSQLMCTKFDYAIVAVWITGFHGWEKRHFIIKRDDERIEKMKQIGRKWWDRHVLPALDCEHPEKYMPQSKKQMRNLEIFDRIERTPGKINNVDSKVYLAWTDKKRALKKAKDEEKAAKEIFYKEFGDAKSIQVLGGGPIFTFKEERGSRGADFDKMKLADPDIYAKYVTRGSRKSLREVKV